MRRWLIVLLCLILMTPIGADELLNILMELEKGMEMVSLGLKESRQGLSEAQNELILLSEESKELKMELVLQTQELEQLKLDLQLSEVRLNDLDTILKEQDAINRRRMGILVVVTAVLSVGLGLTVILK